MRHAAILLTGLVALAVLAALLLTDSTAALPGDTTRVSVDSAGNQANGESHEPAISGDGRYVAFYSRASNLEPGDTNGTWDVFVHERLTGETARVSVASDGSQGNGLSASVRISADGRYVAFCSEASNLVPGDTNSRTDVFTHDRLTGQTTRVTVASDGSQGNSDSCGPEISAAGRYVAFRSLASDLVSDDTNDRADIFIHDRQTGTTERVSVASDGSQGDFESQGPSVSGDGRHVAFTSRATNLVPGDSNGEWDVFVHDRQTGMTERISVASDGSQGSGSSYGGGISDDGRYVVFHSSALNLVPGDPHVTTDVFVHDRLTGETARVSVASDGSQGNAGSQYSSISANGRYVTFKSNASNLVPGDTNSRTDVFAHDRLIGRTTRVSVASDGSQGNLESFGPASVSDDGRFVSFASIASTLVPDDTNDHGDIFVHETDFTGSPPPPPPPTPTPTPPPPTSAIDLVAIDMDTAGNDDSTVGAIDNCGEIPAVGGTLTFDLVVKGVDPADKIKGYQIDIDYDPAVIRMGIDNDGDTLFDEDPVDPWNWDDDGDTVADEDDLDFIDVDGPGSDPPDDVTILSRIDSSGGAGLLSLSDTHWNPASATFVAADATASPLPPANHESGHGVLARVTVTAVGTGTSPLTIPSTLGGADGNVDLTLSAGDGPLAGSPIPITALQGGQVVVGGSCPDSDGDGFTDPVEAFVGTDASDPCADTVAANDEIDDKWPSDFDDNQVVNISDVFKVLPPVFGSSSGDPAYAPRADLAPDGVINITDVFKVLPPVFGSSCTP